MLNNKNELIIGKQVVSLKPSKIDFTSPVILKSLADVSENQADILLRENFDWSRFKIRKMQGLS